MKQKKSAKPSSPTPSREISHDQIAERARAIWQERGQPEGRDLEHWLDAERELREPGQPPASSADLPTDEAREADARLDGLVQRPRES